MQCRIPAWVRNDGNRAITREGAPNRASQKTPQRRVRRAPVVPVGAQGWILFDAPVVEWAFGLDPAHNVPSHDGG